MSLLSPSPNGIYKWCLETSHSLKKKKTNHKQKTPTPCVPLTLAEFFDHVIYIHEAKSLNIYFTFILPSEMLKASPLIPRTGFL